LLGLSRYRALTALALYSDLMLVSLQWNAFRTRPMPNTTSLRGCKSLLVCDLLCIDASWVRLGAVQSQLWRCTALSRLFQCNETHSQPVLCRIQQARAADNHFLHVICCASMLAGSVSAPFSHSFGAVQRSLACCIAMERFHNPPYAEYNKLEGLQVTSCM
jgi:hypothetical protein